MMTEPFSDARIVESWSRNAMQWTAAVRAGQIESRLQVTNQAIIDTIVDRLPRSVLDSGFRLSEVREPLHPKTRKPASIIFVGEMAG